VRMEGGQLNVGFAGGFLFDIFASGHTVPFVECEGGRNGPQRVGASETVS
jgi:hypothetical protein